MRIFFYTLIALAILVGMIFFTQKSANAPASTGGTPMKVLLYFYNSEKDTDITGSVLCSRQGLDPVERDLEIVTELEQHPIDETIRLLLDGQPTDAERAAGIMTEFPLPGLALINSELDTNDILTLFFMDPNNQTTGGSCRVSVLWYQIEATALQFPGVKEVRFSPEELFQP